MSVNKVNSDGSLSRVAGGTLYADLAVGSIIPYGGSTAPNGWFLAQGQAISRTDYSELFAVIGIAFGSGDGSTTFNLPDMRESVPKGAGLTGHTVGAHLDADGLAVGEFLDDRVQEHTHIYTGVHLSSTAYISVSGGSGMDTDDTGTGITEKNTGRTGVTTEVKSVGVNYIIKAKQVAVPADFKDAIDESKPIEVTATLDFNEYGNALVTPPTGYKVISAIMPDHNWAFDVFYDNNRPYVHSRGITDYSAKITGAATLRLVYIKI